MTPALRHRVARFLQWMVQHEHHAGAWLERGSGPPEETAYAFVLRGHRARVQVAKSTMVAARGYFGPATGLTSGTRLYYPNAAGFALIRDTFSLTAPRPAEARATEAGK